MTAENIVRSLCVPESHLRFCEPLSKHTSFKVGGPADVFMIVPDATVLSSVWQMAKEADVPLFLLGRGTNVVFEDAGFRGIVISTAELRSVSVSGTILTAAAGATVNACATTARDASLSGMEFFYGIPGSVGGAVYMNAGAYGGECGNILLDSEYLDPATGKIFRKSGEEHGFSYRHSSYMGSEHIILSARFKLREGDREAIRGSMDDIMGRRLEKQPLEYPSAGSVFKRPEGHFAGKLIEDAGLKGYSCGGAQVSEKHAGFIVNRGGATTENIKTLVSYIQETVLSRFGVELETEICFVPEK